MEKEIKCCLISLILVNIIIQDTSPYDINWCRAQDKKNRHETIQNEQNLMSGYLLQHRGRHIRSLGQKST